MSGIPRWWSPKGHGTEARARRHYRNGEKPCPACLEGQNRAAYLRRGKNTKSRGQR